jgi:heme-degrading monooxygenase HmoA
MRKDIPVPYYAVIFTSILEENVPDYESLAERMEILCSGMDGFLGMDHARSEMGITICYWRDLAAIENWRNHPEHRQAQERGMKEFYRYYKVQLAVVEKAYSAEKKEES